MSVVAPSLASLGLGVRSSLACVLRVCACCARAHSLCACVSVVSHPQVMEGFGYNIYSDLLPSLLRLVEARLREFTAVIKLSRALPTWVSFPDTGWGRELECEPGPHPCTERARGPRTWLCGVVMLRCGVYMACTGAHRSIHWVHLVWGGSARARCVHASVSR